MPSSSSAAHSQAARLAALLAADPANTGLLMAAATAAYEEGDARGCLALLERHGDEASFSAELWNLKGLAAMSLSAFGDAAQAFESALASTDDPTVRFNLAYARAMQGDYEAALAMTGDPALDAVPGAAALRMRSLHHLGRLEEMVTLGEHTLTTRPDAEVAGLLATGLFDAGDLAQARRIAPQALDSSDGCTIAGMLALDDGQPEQAMQLFTQALTLRPHSARALLGQGLGLLEAGQLSAASATLERASRLMSAHAGTWVAAGWAYLLQSEHERALECFERATSIDRGFSEAAGGQAVAYFARHDLAQARHYAEVALRLDPESLSGRYAKSLLLAAEGRSAEAGTLYRQTLELPIGSEERTIAGALARRSGVTIKH